MTAVIAGVLLAVGALAVALAACCGPWWARYVRASYQAHRDAPAVVHLAEAYCHIHAALTTNPEETDQP